MQSNNNNIHLLLYLVSCGLKFREINPDIIADISEARWEEIYNLAKEQGVLAIVFTAIENLPTVTKLPRKIKLQLIVAANAIGNNYQKRYNTATELATAFKEQGVKTTVLKGLAISTYYPIPSYREFGDFDCFLGDNYEAGNCIAEKLGAKVDRDYYRHSHITYKSQLIENHQFCIGVRGSRKMKDFERHLQQIMHHKIEYIDNSNLIRPSCDFNALFLTAHAMTHFLVEGIKLRHICDWAVLLHHEQNNIDWQNFYQWTDRLHYTRFANTITSIAHTYLGLEIVNSQIKQECKYCSSILNDIFQSNSIFNKGYSVWHSRLISIKNRLLSLWKFHKIYQQSAIKTILVQVWGFIFDRNPKL